MRVQLYRNLAIRDQRAWSIKDPKTGKVIPPPLDGAIIRDATFPVSERVRQYMINVRKKKTPHAYVEGELVRAWPLGTMPADEAASASGVRVSYDPYKVGHFVRLDCGQRVDASPLVFVSPAGVFAKLPSCGGTGLSGLWGEWPDDWNG